MSDFIAVFSFYAMAFLAMAIAICGAATVTFWGMLLLIEHVRKALKISEASLASGLGMAFGMVLILTFVIAWAAREGAP